MRRPTVWLAGGTACLLLLAGVAGCNQNGAAGLSGSVTYNGEPVKKGTVAFAPKGGNMAALTVPITDGKYSSSEITPGEFTVSVQGDRMDSGPLTREQAAKLGNLPPSYIPADAQGNGQTVNVSGDGQTLDLTITGPPRS